MRVAAGCCGDACRLCLVLLFFFSSRRRHTRLVGDWSSDVCSSDLGVGLDDDYFLAVHDVALHASLDGSEILDRQVLDVRTQLRGEIVPPSQQTLQGYPLAGRLGAGRLLAELKCFAHQECSRANGGRALHGPGPRAAPAPARWARSVIRLVVAPPPVHAEPSGLLLGGRRQAFERDEAEDGGLQLVQVIGHAAGAEPIHGAPNDERAPFPPDLNATPIAAVPGAGRLVRLPVEVGALERALGMIALDELGAKRKRGALTVDAVLQFAVAELQEAPLYEAERKTELVERRRAAGVEDGLLLDELAALPPRSEGPGRAFRLRENGYENQRCDEHGDASQVR